jgi:hypothetical protein
MASRAAPSPLFEALSVSFGDEPWVEKYLL